MNHVFVDTDILLDLVTGRLPHSVTASSLFTFVEKGQLKSSASSLSFSNMYYVLRKFAAHQKVVSALTELSGLLRILKVDESIIKEALHSKFTDFEDAIQYHTALSDPGVDAIVTRNIKDYRKSKLTVMSPETFLKTYLHTS